MGRTEVMDWLWENMKEEERVKFRRFCTYDSLKLAAERGHLEALIWIEDHVPLNLEAILNHNLNTWIEVARGGHLEALKWLRKNNFPWNSKVCIAAGQGGHLEVLQWAREEGCPWPPDFFYGVIHRSDNSADLLKILDWARANGAPTGLDPFLAAITRSEIEILDWLLANGFSLAPELWYHALTWQSMESLKWLQQKKCPELSTRGFQDAVDRVGDPEVLEWIKTTFELEPKPKREDFWL
jgi:hypothetical protein